MRLQELLAFGPHHPFSNPNCILRQHNSQANNKSELHQYNLLINVICAASYYLIWSGRASVQIDIGSSLFIPQRRGRDWLGIVIRVPLHPSSEANVPDL